MDRLPLCVQDIVAEYAQISIDQEIQNALDILLPYTQIEGIIIRVTYANNRYRCEYMYQKTDDGIHLNRVNDYLNLEDSNLVQLFIELSGPIPSIADILDESWVGNPQRRLRIWGDCEFINKFDDRLRIELIHDYVKIVNGRSYRFNR